MVSMSAPSREISLDAKTKQREQRKYHRYPVSMPVRISFKDPNAAPRIAQAKDMSSHGIYITASESFEMGTSLDLEMEMPPSLVAGAHVRLHCRARIIRVENLSGSKNRVGAAAQITNFRMIRPEAD